MRPRGLDDGSGTLGAVTTPDTLEHPLFPQLAWTGDGWEGFAPRPAAWQGLRVASESHLRGGETSFAVTVTCSSGAAPSEAQCAAYRAFLEGGEPLVTLVLEAVLDHYRGLRARWLAKHPRLDLPAPERVEDLTQLTRLSSVYVHERLDAGHVHLGIALRAAWDPEHGAGVLLRGGRVVRVGTHDDAMLEPGPKDPIGGAPKRAKPAAKKAKPAAKKAKPAAKKAKPAAKKAEPAARAPAKKRGKAKPAGRVKRPTKVSATRAAPRPTGKKRRSS